MYQKVGKCISKKLRKRSMALNLLIIWKIFLINHPELKGFKRRELYRMKQFYELYSYDEKVSTLLTQLSWSNHLKIIPGSKSKEEIEFYINLAIKENLTYRK